MNNHTLSKEDIESYGFSLTGRSVCNWYNVAKRIELPLFIGHFKYYWQLVHNHQQGGVIIEAKEHSNDKEWEKFYEGLCSTKAELQDILIKIGYLKIQ